MVLRNYIWMNMRLIFYYSCNLNTGCMSEYGSVLVPVTYTSLRILPYHKFSMKCRLCIGLHHISCKGCKNFFIFLRFESRLINKTLRISQYMKHKNVKIFSICKQPYHNLNLNLIKVLYQSSTANYLFFRFEPRYTKTLRFFPYANSLTIISISILSKLYTNLQPQTIYFSGSSQAIQKRYDFFRMQTVFT